MSTFATMSFTYNHFNLPVSEVIPEVKEGLNNRNTLIIKAPTGAGKSTLLPIALLEEQWLKGKKIIMLEPRRLAAKTVAMRMADMIGEQVGETVGYRIRFEQKISKKTRLEVVTEGILTRLIHQDNSLEDTGLIIFDEFHERSIHADLAMAFTKEIQGVLRQDLRILVMSATINMPELALRLNAVEVQSEGRMYPVDLHYEGDSDWKILPEMVCQVVKKAIKSQDGDVLVFLPGQSEIKKSQELLRRSLINFKIVPLYGQLSPSKQFAAIMPDSGGKRKVILATNIAETSLTVQGVKIVIDSGFERVAKFNSKSGLSRLETVQISKESADQRKGRAGRLTEGVCYRLWSKVTQSRMKEQSIPEIEQADLTSLVLDLAKWGITDFNHLFWVTPPPFGNIQKAKKLLEELGAIENGKITPHGIQLHNVPTHPRIGQMMVQAQEIGQLALATDIAPLLEEKDPLPPKSGIDINLRIEALRRFRKEGKGSKQFSRLEKLAEQYRRMFGIEPDNGMIDDHDTGLLIASAYPERIASSRPGNNAQFQMANGKMAAAGHLDDLAHEQWLAIAHVTERENGGKIFMASPINPRDLLSKVITKEIVKWDTDDGGLIAREEMRIGSIVLKSSPIPNPNPEKLIEAITEAIAEKGRQLLDWNKDVVQLLYRVNSLRKWNPNLKLPEYSIEALLATNKEWIISYLPEVKKPQDLRKIDLKEILYYALTIEQQKKIDVLVPSKVRLPNGTFAKLEYQENCSEPVLAVPLQRCFGMLETPKVNGGRINVLMHLLSPGFKVVQITNDLNSFWEKTYFEVRKELRIRYKKHKWPENPLET